MSQRLNEKGHCLLITDVYADVFMEIVNAYGVEVSLCGDMLGGGCGSQDFIFLAPLTQTLLQTSLESCPHKADYFAGTHGPKDILERPAFYNLTPSWLFATAKIHRQIDDFAKKKVTSGSASRAIPCASDLSCE